jgi:hypothetical protein
MVNVLDVLRSERNSPRDLSSVRSIPSVRFHMVKMWFKFISH